MYLVFPGNLKVFKNPHRFNILQNNNFPNVLYKTWTLMKIHALLIAYILPNVSEATQ